ncbi:PXA domain-containing protein [Cercophora samala]|uniref:PXA domain-containing protein n=1 Tax=Cercophora samala TaxID=330535 RepID=A0AA39ZES9_9PEZI|nr:PXA domain-containing protein [Cercophora samala]
MTTAAAQAPSRVQTPNPPPGPVTPRPKPSRTSSLQSESGPTSKSAPADASRTPPQSGGAAARRNARPALPTTDPLSDKATTLLIRRILCPQHLEKAKNAPAPIEELLPPLTSRNDVDLQLYALIAIILREYVQNWYNKITPDETFVAEIVQIIAHITRALEQRLRNVDLERLLFDEIPDLLDKHITAYRIAHDPITQAPIRTNAREIYHSLCPLPALSPVPRPEDPESVAQQAQNEVAYRQLLVHAVLAILLPTEDLENGCLTALVGQIFSELIIGNSVANKLSEPWMILEMIIIATRTLDKRKAIEDENPSGRPGKGSSAGRSGFSSVQGLFWMVVHWCFLATSFIRLAFTVLMTTRSLPPRSSHSTAQRKNVAQHEALLDSGPVKVPVLAFRCWSAISNLIEMDVRMPWLCGTLSMVQWVTMTGPGRIAAVDGKLDRLLSHGIHRYMLNQDNGPLALPPLLRNVRGALFPGNAPGKGTLVAPADEEGLRALRRRSARAVWRLLGGRVGRVYFGFSPFGAGAAGAAAADTKKPFGSEEKKKGLESSEGGSSSSPSSSSAGEDGGTGGGKRKKMARFDSDPVSVADMTAAAAAGSSSSRQHHHHHHHHHHRKRASKDEGGGASGRRHHRRTKSKAATAAAVPIDTTTDEEAATTPEEEEILAEIERGVLDVFSDAYCNKHLVYSLVELILVRLMPEIGERGVLELWAERGVSVGVDYT